MHNRGSDIHPLSIPCLFACCHVVYLNRSSRVTAQEKDYGLMTEFGVSAIEINE